MKIFIDDEQVYELTDDQLDIFKHKLPEAEIKNDIVRCIMWRIDAILEEEVNIIKNTYTPILIGKGLTAIPVNSEELLTLIKQDPDYKDRDTRDAELAVQRAALFQAAPSEL